MDKSYKFIVPGEPQGKARPRFVRGRSVRTYTPAKTHHYEDLVRYYATHDRKAPITDSCSIKVKAYFSVPKSYSKKHRQLCLDGAERPTKKPDSDNIAKIVLDGLNPKTRLNRVLHKREVIANGFYEDDKQVVHLEVDKFYSTEPRIEVIISWR